MQEQKVLKVVLADRDGFYLQKLKRSLERKGGIVVVGTTDSGVEVLDMIENHHADMVLMDIVLGDRDGFWVLEKMQERELQCSCIIISALGSDKMVRNAIALGAEYFMAKPVQGDILIERIQQIVGIQSNVPREIIAESVEKGMGISEIRPFGNLEAEISAILSKMGISASIKGYHFIRRAVMMAVENEEALIGITKGLYPDIGKLYKTSASKVERAIRHAIESAWKKNGKSIYFEIAGFFAEDKPTNGQFIASLTEFFRLQQQEQIRKIC